MENSIKKKSVDSASTEVHSNPNSGSHCSNDATNAVYKNQCQPVIRSKFTAGECRQPRREEEQQYCQEFLLTEPFKLSIIAQKAIAVVQAGGVL